MLYTDFTKALPKDHTVPMYISFVPTKVVDSHLSHNLHMLNNFKHSLQLHYTAKGLICKYRTPGCSSIKGPEHF